MKQISNTQEIQNKNISLIIFPGVTDKISTVK